MAIASKCPACPNNTFELAIESPKGASFKYAFIRCWACGTVVGVADALYVSAILEEQNKAIKAIADHLGVPIRFSN